jgi:hypothetical protein
VLLAKVRPHHTGAQYLNPMNRLDEPDEIVCNTPVLRMHRLSRPSLLFQALFDQNWASGDPAEALQVIFFE